MTERDTHNDKQEKGSSSSHAGGRGSGNGRVALGACCGVVLLVVFFILGLAPKMRRNHEIEARAQGVASEAPKVAVVKPAPAPEVALVLPGSTEAIIDAQVGARTTGYVVKRYAEIGDHVKAGQVLAEIESPDVDQQLYQANSQLAQSKAAVRQSQSDVANKQAMVAQSRSSLKQTQANLEQAKAQYADAQAKLAQLESAEKTAEAQREQAVQNVDIKKSALAQANTQLGLAKVTYERYETLLKAGYVALQDVDQTKAAYDNAQAQVKSAQSDLNASQKAVDAQDALVRSAQANIASGEAQVKASEKNVNAVEATVGAAQSAIQAAQANVKGSQSTVEANRFAQDASQFNTQRYKVLTSFEKVTAPFDGVITARNIDVGSLVNAGAGAATGGSTPSNTTGSSTAAPSAGLYSIARTDTLRILVPVPQAYSPLMHPRLTTHILLREFPGQVFQGAVTNVSGALDTGSRTLLTEVHIPNPTGKLLPGMYAQVSFDLPKTQHGLRVPATAVIFDSQGTRVMTVDSENKLHFATVKVGRDFNTELELIAGITPGDTLVASPSDDMTEDEKVTPFAAPPPPQASGGGAAGPGRAADQGSKPAVKSSGGHGTNAVAPQ